MKNKRISIVLALVVIFQLMLVISPPIYEGIAFSRCEKYGKEYKVKIPSLQINLYDPEYRENQLYINIRNYYDDLSAINNKVGFLTDERGFCLWDYYGDYDESTYVGRVEKRFLYGSGYAESTLILSDGFTIEGMAEYLDKKTGETYRDDLCYDYYGGYFSFDFLESYGVEAYITVRIYKGIMIKEAFYLDGERVFEFKK